MDGDLISYIKEQKEIFKDRVTILAHHYQNIEIVKLADIVGDSYKLAVEGSKSKSEFIVFCGVRFMAEGAGILAKESQKILMPALSAGCPMAEMIDAATAKQVYDRIECDREVAPVVYVNSYGDMKSFCGQRGGSTCTSSNAKKILEWYFNQGKGVFFSPDYNLGINTAKLLGLNKEEIVKVKRDLSFETQGDMKKARLFLWNGFCIVHRVFTVSDIVDLREKYEGIKIIVHPECNEEVVSMADLSGSTEKIWQTVKDAAPGSVWGVGTEFNFVARLAGECKDKKVLPLRESRCRNMEEITLAGLAECLKSISLHLEGTGDLKYEIKASDEYKENAKKSLERMIMISEGKLIEKNL